MMILALAAPAWAEFVDFTSGEKSGSGLTITAKYNVNINWNPWTTGTNGGIATSVYSGDLGMLGTTSTTMPVAPATNYFGLGVGTYGPITFREALVFDFATPQDPKNAMYFGQMQSSTNLSFTLLGTNLLASGGSGAPADSVRVFLKFVDGTVLPFDINAGALSPGGISPDALNWNYWIRWALNQVNYADERVSGLAVMQMYGSLATPNREFGVGSITYDAPAPVPEPLTLLLLGAGLIGITGIRRFTK